MFHQAAAGHRTTDVEMDLTVNGHRTKKDPQKENENIILVKITTKEYEGYRKIIRIAKKTQRSGKNKNGRRRRRNTKPKKTIYIKYNRKKEMNRAHIEMKEEEKKAEIVN